MIECVVAVAACAPRGVLVNDLSAIGVGVKSVATAQRQIHRIVKAVNTCDISLERAKLTVMRGAVVQLEQMATAGSTLGLQSFICTVDNGIQCIAAAIPVI